MKAVLSIPSVLLLLSGSNISAPADTPAAEEHWKKLLSKVQVGMRRAVVGKVLSRTEAILDIDLEPPAGAKSEKKKGRTALYILDEDWCATITFDSTGFTTRNNPYLVLHLPENKVIAGPKLLRRTAALNEKIEEYTSK